MSLLPKTIGLSIEPEEIITSGDYDSAEIFLSSKSSTAELLPEDFYRLGNLFFSSGQKQAAKRAWQKSYSLSDFNIEVPTRNVSVSHEDKKYYLKNLEEKIF